eukprot:1950230-Rhodomonas_salina.1
MSRRIDDDDFEEFADRVEDVGACCLEMLACMSEQGGGLLVLNYLVFAEKTIKALMEGKLDLEEVDRKEEEIKRKQRETEERKEKKKLREEYMRRAAVRAAERKKWGFYGTEPADGDTADGGARGAARTRLRSWRKFTEKMIQSGRRPPPTSA